MTLTVTPEPGTTALSLQYEYEDTSAPRLSQVSGRMLNGGQAPFSSLWAFKAQPSGQTSQSTFDATGIAIFTDGATSATVPLNSQGLATWSPQVLSVGQHSVTVSYSGDASYNPSTAPPLTFTVTPGMAILNATLETRPVQTSLGSLLSYPAGSNAPIHVLLQALNSFVPPTGNVSVNFGPYSQTVPVSAVSYSNQGLSVANVTFNAVPAGTYSLSVSYTGDSNWMAANFQSSVSYTFASATPTPTTTALSVSSSNVNSSGSVKFTVTLSANQGQSAPVGLVLLYANGTIFNEISTGVSTSFSASPFVGSIDVPASELPAGALQIVAQYLGGFTFAPSSSAPVPLNVTFTDFTMSAAASHVAIKSGQSATVPLLLGGPNGGSTTVSFSCLPSSPKFGCAVSPATQVVSGTTSASLTINAYVPGPAAVNGLGGSGLGREFLAASAAIALSFTFLFAASGGKRQGLFLCLTLIAVGTFLAGCGSIVGQNTITPPPNVNTPAGTYSVLVKGTSGGVTHNVTFQVMIQ